MLDQNTLATLITICATVFATVWVAAYNNRRAKERVAQEANRAKKVEAYHAFLDMLMRIFKSGGLGSVSEADLKESVTDFIGTAMIYGSPSVIKAIGEWRAAADDRNKQLLLVDNLLRESGWTWAKATRESAATILRASSSSAVDLPSRRDYVSKSGVRLGLAASNTCANSQLRAALSQTRPRSKNALM